MSAISSILDYTNIIFGNEICKMKLLPTTFSILFGLAFMQSQLSADVLNNTKLADKPINLAMLDLTKYGFILPENNANKKRKPVLFPRNCTDWTDWQIKQKAQPFNESISNYSRQHGVDSNLIKSVITAESCFKVKALSHAGARGLMQLIPATAERFGVKNSYSPDQNIRGGVKYLKFLLKRYQGNLEKTIAAYNAGEGKVDRYKGIPPYKETKQYVKNVLKVYARLKPKPKAKQSLNNNSGQRTKTRANAVKIPTYRPPKLGQKAGRHGWKYNRSLAPHLYKQ